MQHKPFKQVLNYPADAQIMITGEEYQELRKLVTLSGNLNYTRLMNTIFERNLNAGIINVKYETLEGYEMSVDEVKEIMEDVRALNRREE